jgi:NAD(P)-dependent dehydrogenase (short-subunit alcohol dehydrogenase family)
MEANAYSKTSTRTSAASPRGPRGSAGGQAVVARIRDAGGKADYVHADLDGTAASRALGEKATGLLGGRIDILVNNAGIFPGHTTLATDEEEFDRVYAVIDGGRVNVLTSAAGAAVHP